MPQPGNTSLARSFHIQLNVLRALFLREVMTRYGRHNIGFLWLFMEPMLFTMGIAAMWTLLKLHQLSSLPIAVFALTGYSTVLLWRNMPSRCIGALAPNTALLYHRNVKIIDIFWARIMLEAVGATTSFTLLSLLMISIGMIQPPENIPLLVLGWFIVAWFGASLGLFLGALSERSELVDKFWHAVSYLMWPLSGAAYMVDALPERLQHIVLFLPIVHGTEIIRDGFFGSYFTAHYSISYACTVCASITALGLALERRLSRDGIVI